jgi:hypothetical protein
MFSKRMAPNSIQRPKNTDSTVRKWQDLMKACKKGRREETRRVERCGDPETTCYLKTKNSEQALSSFANRPSSLH